jgi:predicted dehydrogenase
MTRVSNDDRDGTGISRRSFLGRSSAILAGAAVTPALIAAATSNGSSLAFKPLDPAKKIRMGVVGGGFGLSFQWHLDPNCVVQAVSDRRADRRERLKQVYRCNRAYPTLDELIKDRSIDAIAIFTGAPDHAAHAIAAMKAGKHVVSAVPACITIEQAGALRDAVKKTGMTYMLCETSWFHPTGILARDLHASGAFGRLFYSEVEYNHPSTEADLKQVWFREGKRTWRHGNPPMLYPTHATSYLIGTTGERLTDVSCLGVLAPRIEGYGVGQNQYGNAYNAMMGLFSTNKGNVCRANVVWTGTNSGERAQWFGTDLSLYMPNESSGQPLHGQGLKKPTQIEVPDYAAQLPKPMRVASDHGGSHPFLTHEFIASLVEKRRPAIDIHEALALTVPGIIANESAKRGGERLKIPSFDAPAVRS